MTSNTVNSFRELLENREKMFEELNKQVQQQAQGGRQTDERIWYPARDKAGNGYAVIRFLPPPKGENSPFVREWTHGFKGPGGWYIEKSLTTLGLEDPVSEYNQKQWALDTKEAREAVSKRKRTLNYWANVYIVEDTLNPENNGTVRLFRFGAQLFKLIDDAMNPKFPNEPKINPFDPIGGANLIIKIYTERSPDNPKGFPKYDRSRFDAPSQMLPTIEEIETVWNSQWSLQELVAPSTFKSYDELKRQFHRAMGWNTPSPGADLPVEKPVQPPTDNLSEGSKLPWDSGSDGFADTAPSSTPPGGGGEEEDELEMYRRMLAQK